MIKKYKKSNQERRHALEYHLTSNAPFTVNVATTLSVVRQ